MRGGPYRTMAVTEPSAGSPWRRWLVGSCGALRDSAWWRRWAGGRWAKYACIYNAAGPLSFRDMFTLADMAVEAMHGCRFEAGTGYAFSLLEDQWRRVDACPHEAMAFMVVGADGGPAIERRRVPCTCEVYDRGRLA